MKDFFISYNREDKQWAEWIAWQLEEAGYSVVFQAWDFAGNWLIKMDQAMRETARTIAVLSPNYTKALYTHSEWANAFRLDPTGERDLLLPVRVQPVDLEGVLAQIVHVDLVNSTEATAIELLLKRVRGERGKPSVRPTFPSSGTKRTDRHRAVASKPSYPAFGEDMKRVIHARDLPQGAEHKSVAEAKQDKPNHRQRHREALIGRVHRELIERGLHQSLYKLGRIELELEETPSAVAEGLGLGAFPTAAPTPVPAGTPILDVFEKCGKALLVLAKPGCGKTTLLLELTERLLERASQDDHELVPVVFHLSSWAKRRLPLAQWLVAYLDDKKYGRVPEELAEEWVNNGEIIPLLDGLDTVAVNHRGQCVEAINAFHSDHPGLPIAVCSRKDDYETAGKKVQLAGAIEIHPLTPDQLRDYLQRFGEMQAVRAALAADASLSKPLDTPRMLWVAKEAYKDFPLEVSGESNLDQRRTHLFAKFVDEMLKDRSTHARSWLRALARASGKKEHPVIPSPYPSQQARSWLSALACALNRRGEEVFYLEDLRPEWLATPAQTWFSIGATLLAAGLFVGLFFGLIDGIIIGLNRGPLAGLGQGAVVALLFGLIYTACALLIWLMERVSIGLMDISRRRRATVVGLGAWAIFALIVVGIEWRNQGLIKGLITGVIEGLIVGFLVGVASLLRPQPRETRRVPNEGTHHSAIVALATVLIIEVIAAPVAWTFTGQSRAGTFDWLFPGMFLGFVGGLAFGGLFCIGHVVLRLVLWIIGEAPLRYVKFLDYAVDRQLMKKDGGGYMFLDPTLSKYLASLEASRGSGFAIQT